MKTIPIAPPFNTARRINVNEAEKIIGAKVDGRVAYWECDGLVLISAARVCDDRTIEGRGWGAKVMSYQNLPRSLVLAPLNASVSP